MCMCVNMCVGVLVGGYKCMGIDGCVHMCVGELAFLFQLCVGVYEYLCV